MGLGDTYAKLVSEHSMIKREQYSIILALRNGL